MGPGDIVPVRRASIKLVPPEQDDSDQIEEPTKTDTEYYGDPNTAAGPRRKIPSFEFNFAGSPALGESAITPPQRSQSRFTQQPHARASSSAVPWQQPGESLPAADRSQMFAPVNELSAPQIEESRFSQNTSSLSDPSGTPPSPAANQSFFSPTTVVEDNAVENSSPDTLPAIAQPLLPFDSAAQFDSSPPPLALRGEASMQPPPPPPRSPASPSAWRSFFTGPLPLGQSRFSASTTSPQTGEQYSPPSPSPPSSSGSSSDSFDGTTSSPLMALPQLATIGPQRRTLTSSSNQYPHAYPTTYLEAIDEDGVYPSSPPPVPRRSSDRPRAETLYSEAQTSEGPSSSAEFEDTPAGALAALSAAAAVGPASSARSSLRLHPPPPVATTEILKRWSRPPQIPPLPPFDHNTSSLQRLFSYYPSPRLPTETPHLSQQPFPTSVMPMSPASSILSYGSVLGPQGERFSSLREKRQSRGVYWADGTPKRTHRWCGIQGMSWKMWAVVLLVLILIFGIIAVGVGVGLGQANNNDNANLGSNGGGVVNEDPPPIENQPVFPAGAFRISTNLRNVTTSCSNVSASWNCAPGAAQTYWEAGVNSSAITVLWKVSQNNLTEGAEGNGFAISSAGDPFALRFSNASLTLREAGGENEHWGFETRVKKRVRPWVDISGRNAAVECDYDNVELSARLFTRRQPAEGLGGGDDAWPGAVEVEERSEIEGSCAEVRNGVLGQRVAVGTGPAECLCGYSNQQFGDD